VYYVSQTPANRVARFAADGSPRAPLGVGAAKLFDQPTAAVETSNGAIFVYEPDSGHLQLHAPDGRLLFSLQAPRVSTLESGSMAALPDGRVLLADGPDHRLNVYSPAGALLGYVPVDGTPQGLAVTPQGTVAVADSQNRIVRVYAANPGG
jgi:sugar lactone lactonase YvrE